MCANRANASGLLLACVLFLGGCAINTAPKGFLVTGDGEQTDTYGGWIDLELYDERELEGELIAIDGDSLFVMLEGRPSTLVALHGRKIRKARLRAYDPQTDKYAPWVVLGTVSTISHGIGLTLTAPLWILGGSSSVATQSKMADYGYPGPEAVEMRKFARFPQGMPEGIDRRRLQARWVSGRR